MHRFVYVLTVAFIATIVGSALYAHGVADRDTLLLTYQVAEGIGLGYLALKRFVCWVGSWRLMRVQSPARMGR